MRKTRVMPCLLLRNRGLVKTVRFANPVYVGDPVNTVRIFNEREVDEIVILDIAATPANRGPNFGLLDEIASECFMPFCYGGGIRSLDDMKTLFGLGAEKVCLNSAAVEAPTLIRQAASRFGNQSVVVSIDARRKGNGTYKVVSRCGSAETPREPVAWAKEVVSLGAGEILLTAIDREGAFEGYDVDLIRSVTSAVSVPVIANGGAREIGDFSKAVLGAGAAAVAAGSMFVFQGPHRAVLVNYPTREDLKKVVP